MKFSLKKEDKKHKDINSEELVLENSIKEEAVQEKQDDEFNPWNYIRVVNVKGEPEYQATSDEKVIIGHRANPILGNRHIMQEKSMKERDRVIAEYKKDLETDLAMQGPIWQTLQGIAKDIVETKQKFAISCHCSPIKCHNDLVIPVVVNMVENLLEQKNKNTVKYKNKF